MRPTLPFVALLALVGAACSTAAGDGAQSSEESLVPIGTIRPPRPDPCRLGLCEAPVLTQRNDVSRSGASVRARVTAANVAQKWSWLATLGVDGSVFAQPLYVPRLATSDGKTRNVVFVATSHNHVYGFDADTYERLWDNVGPHWDDGDDTDPALAPGGQRAGCTYCAPGGIGILGTPVIDGATNVMYVSYRSLVPGQGARQGRQWIRRIDVRSGHTIGDDHPVVLEAGMTRTPSNDTTPWDAGLVRQRTSLLLDHGTLYIGFAMRCEELWSDYHGWLLAYDVTGGAPRGIAALDTAPTSRGGGIWQASSGPAADAQGRVYFMTGNNMKETFVPPSSSEISGSFVRARVTRDGAPRFVVEDTFTPYRAAWQQGTDMDLGSSGPVLLPSMNRVVGGGKEGVLYVLDQNHLGGFDQRCDPTTRTLSHAQKVACGLEDDGAAHFDDPGADTVVQKLESVHNHWRSPTMNDWFQWPHIHGTPVAASVGGVERLYVWAEKDQLRSFVFDGTRFVDGPTGGTFAPDRGMPGGMLTLSTDLGASSGIVWGSVTKDLDGPHGELYAYDAITLRELWNNANDDYLFGRFVPPTVADGKVFLPTFSGEVLVYGQRTAQTSSIATATQGANQLDMVSVADDGSLVVTWEAGGSKWTSPPVSITPPHLAPPGGGVALAHQGDNQLDAFVIGNDGGLYVTWVVGSGQWAQPVRLTAPGFALPGSRLAAAHQGNNQVDVFVVDANGAVRVLWVDGLGTWQGPASLTGNGFAPAGAALAADSQGANQLDLFVVGNDGAVNVLWVIGGGVWQGPAALSGAGFAPAGAGVATAHQGPNQLDLFVVGNNGAANVLWVQGGGTWQGPVGITGASFAPAGAMVAAANQGPDQVDLFMVNDAGAPSVLWVQGGGHWQGPASIGPNGYAPPGAPVSAIPQGAAQLDLLVGGWHQSVSWVQGGGTWQGPARIF